MKPFWKRVLSISCIQCVGENWEGKEVTNTIGLMGYIIIMRASRVLRTEH